MPGGQRFRNVVRRGGLSRCEIATLRDMRWGRILDARFLGTLGRESLAGGHHRLVCGAEKSEERRACARGSDRNRMEKARGLGFASGYQLLPEQSVRKP